MAIAILGSQSLDERAKVLDTWLRDVLNDSWSIVASGWGFGAGHSLLCHQQAWRFFLPAMYAARRLARGYTQSEIAAVDAILSLAPSMRQVAGALVLIDPHEALRDDLSGVWHPSLEGVRVQVVRPESSVSSLDYVTSALELLNRASPRSSELVSDHCGAICFISPEQSAVQGLCVSTTSKSIPGLLYLSPVPTLLSAESLVHESAHLKLAILETERELFHNPNARVRTPLRSDPRPISGLLHQVWVLVHLRELYRDLLRDSSQIVRVNFGKMEARLALHERDLSDGLAAAEAARSEFTDDGWRFVEKLMRRAKELTSVD